jgi:hypothetical protein
MLVVAEIVGALMLVPAEIVGALTLPDAVTFTEKTFANCLPELPIADTLFVLGNNPANDGLLNVFND